MKDILNINNELYFVDTLEDTEKYVLIDTGDTNKPVHIIPHIDIFNFLLILKYL